MSPGAMDGTETLRDRVLELELELVARILAGGEGDEALRSTSERGLLPFAILREGDLVFVSRPFSDALGAEATLDHLASSMGEGGRAILDRAIAGETITCALADGRHELSLRPAETPEGGVTLLVLTEAPDTPSSAIVELGRAAELADALRMLHLVLDTIPVRVFWKDLQGNYLGCNTLFAQDAGEERPADLLGRDDYSLGWRDQAQAYRADDFTVIESGEAKLNYEEPQTTPDGGTIWLRTSKIPFRNAADQIIGVLGTYEDITLQKRLTEQNLHREKLEAIGRLAGGVAHDFNNMLTAIISAVDLLERRLGGEPSIPAKVLDPIALIREASHGAANLTRQLLGFARKQIVRPRRIDPHEQIGRLTRLLDRLLGERVQLEVSLADEARTITIDPGQFEQLLVNLAVNARDAMPEGGTLTFETHNVELDRAGAAVRELPEGRYLKLVVRDTGVGIDPAQQKHVFEPFFTTKGPSEGTGLGLATCHGIVKQNHGHIELASVPGEGSSFTIHLPQPTNDEEEAIVDTPPPPTLEHGSETILVVEDEPTVRRACVSAFQSHGYHVLDAGSVAEALRVAGRKPGEIDAIVSDVVLPDGDGPSLAEKLLEIHPTAKVLYVSGYAENTVVHRSSTTSSRFLQKPYSPTQIRRELRRLLDADPG